MDNILIFEKLKKEYNLIDMDYQFLEIIPLIKMIWADGHNQIDELKILHKFINKYVLEINKKNKCIVISNEDYKSFQKRFMLKKPDNKLLDSLEELTKFFNKHVECHNRVEIFNYCTDIAAACTLEPKDIHNRVTLEEKKLLQKLGFQVGYTENYD